MTRCALLTACLVLSACATAPQMAAPAVFASDATSDGAIVTYERATLDDPADRKLVRNATLALDVGSDEEVEATLASASDLTQSLGGYVAFEGPGAMTLRIPDARLDDALDQLAALGEVERREVRAQDVTAAYTDVQIRLDNARALQTRLRALLAEAETVLETVEVERELSRVTTEVEQLEGQMRLLDNQIAFSTVRLTVRDTARPGPLGWVFVGLYEAVKWLFVWE